MDPGARAELSARLGAWWDGRDYVPPEPAETEEAAAANSEPQPTPPPAPPSEPEPEVSSANAVPPPRKRRRAAAAADFDSSDGPDPRVRALETLWGEGRFAAGSGALDQLLLDEAFGSSDAAGEIGFLGADAALMLACRARSNRPIAASDWRTGCAARVEALVEGVAVERSEPDRPKGLPASGLASLVSLDALAFADHKAGLIARAHKALGDAGRWIVLDTVRTTRRAPAEAFASAWAEPQLANAEELEELLRLAGFRILRSISVSDLVIGAAREGYARLSGALEEAVRSGQSGRSGALYLQELAWEAASWRARMRALEGGALSALVWTLEKGGDDAPTGRSAPAATIVPASSTKRAAVESSPKQEPATEADPAPEEAGPPDQSSIDSLFD
jgi:hypothetical protein